jgi:hypothetical protein
MEYKKIIDEILNENFTNTENFSIRYDEHRIHISYEHCTFNTIFIDSNKGTFSMFTHSSKNELESTDEYCFKVYTSLIFDNIKNELINSYKKKYIKTLPFEYKVKNKNLNITANVFKEIFEEISEEYSNSETIDNVEVKKEKNSTIISFELNCGRRGRYDDNWIEINEFGVVQTHLSEIIEGGDLDSNIKDKLEELCQ